MNKRFLRKLFTIIPVFVSFVSCGIYFAISFSSKPSENNNNNNSKSQSGDDSNNKSEIEKELGGFSSDVFPKVEQEYFYRYIRLKDGQPYLNDDFIARVINYVLTKVHFTNGNLKWWYQFKDLKIRDNLLLNFAWSPDSHYSQFHTIGILYEIKTHYQV